MAEGLIRARAESCADCAIQVMSAGTWVKDAAPATANALEVLARRGIDLRQHRSREVTDEMLGWADLVLVMTDGHRQALEADFPSARGKVRLISSLGGGSWDVADPVGRPVEDYAATAAEIERLIDAGWDFIAAESP